MRKQLKDEITGNLAELVNQLLSYFSPNLFKSGESIIHKTDDIPRYTS